MASFAAAIILRLSSVIANRLGANGTITMSRFIGLFLFVSGLQLLADSVAKFIAAGEEREIGSAIPSPGDQAPTSR